jgi:hypothetical protein
MTKHPSIFFRGGGGDFFLKNPIKENPKVDIHIGFWIQGRTSRKKYFERGRY